MIAIDVAPSHMNQISVFELSLYVPFVCWTARPPPTLLRTALYFCGAAERHMGRRSRGQVNANFYVRITLLQLLRPDWTFPILGRLVSAAGQQASKQQQQRLQQRADAGRPCGPHGAALGLKPQERPAAEKI